MTQVPLYIQELTKVFEPGLWARWRHKKQPFTTVNNISFELKASEILGFLGPNGAGKTTTIQMLLDVFTPASGSVYYMGKNLATHHNILQKVSFASGYTRLPSSLTVYQCLLVNGMLYDMSLETLRHKIPLILEQFGITYLSDRNASTLSAGQTTCVLLARAFLVEPRIVLLDEPTTALDPENAHLVREFIKKQNQEHNIAILFTSHNMGEVAELCDRILVLKEGVIIADNTPKYLASSISRTHVQLVSVDHLPQLIKFAQSNMKYLNLFLILLIINSGLHAMQPDPPVSMQGDPQDAAVQNVCPICLIADLDAGNKDNPTFVLLCGHRFCRACITHWLARTNKCPICLHQFEHGLHWPLAGHNIDRVNVLNNIAMWGPSVSLAVCFSAILLLIVRKLTTG